MSSSEKSPDGKSPTPQPNHAVGGLIRIILDGLEADMSIAELCHREGVQLSDVVAELDRLLVLYDESLSSAGHLQQQLAQLDTDLRQLKKINDDCNTQIKALELDLEILGKKKDDSVLYAEWLELELDTLKSSTLWQLMQPARTLIRRTRSGYRLSQRFLYALYRFGPIDTIRRTRSYLGYQKPLKRPAYTPTTQAHDVSQRAAADFAMAPPQSPGQEDHSPWAMYVGDFLDGGLEKVVLDLAFELSARGKSCSIIVSGRSGRAAEEARRLGIKVVEFDGDAAGVVQFVVDNRIARVITHHCYDFLEQISATGVVVDEVIHNAYHWQRGDQRLAAMRKNIIKSCIAVSEFVNSYAIQELKINPEKLRVIHNGLGREGLIRPPVELMRQRRLDTLSTPVFVMLANAHPQKNHIAVLHAMRAIREVYPTARLYMCGVIDQSTNLGKAIHSTAQRLQLLPAVDFTGPLDREAVSRLLSIAHVALLPTLLEGFSLASLEYCYFGLPMILATTGASQTLQQAFSSVELAADVALPASQLNPSTIERHSLHPDERNVAGIVFAMNRVLSNYPEYLRNAERGAQDWKQYSLESTVDHYLLLDHAE